MKRVTARKAQQLSKRGRKIYRRLHYDGMFGFDVRYYVSTARVAHAQKGTR
jgi:hypothetical protein